jgi:flavin reductase (DIM6/NTAB) family NADH-FMN oxidoreductase RutF
MEMREPSKYVPLTFPRLTVLVTVLDGEGRPNAITISWHSPVSRDPPLYGLSVAFSRASHPMLEETGEWVVNFLPLEKVREVHFCGTRSGRKADKLAETGLTPVPSSRVGPPILAEAYAALECRLMDSRPLGDHTWFTGEVVAAHGPAGTLDGKVLGPHLEPLFYLGSNTYCTWKGDRESQ